MPFGIRIDIGNRHDAAILARLDFLYLNQRAIMATLEELVAAAAEVAAQVPVVADAVNALEAKITEVLSQVGGLTPEQQAAIDGAVASLRGAVAGLTAVSADAADGVDEAVPAP